MPQLQTADQFIAPRGRDTENRQPHYLKKKHKIKTKQPALFSSARRLLN